MFGKVEITSDGEQMTSLELSEHSIWENHKTSRSERRRDHQRGDDSRGN